MAQTDMTLDRNLGYLAARPLPILAQVAVQVAVTVAKWDERRRTRTALGQLDSHLLRDVGLSRDTALREARRAFWQG